jgi:hypothetical protein
VAEVERYWIRYQILQRKRSGWRWWPTRYVWSKVYTSGATVSSDDEMIQDLRRCWEHARILGVGRGTAPDA